jgi:hypothetical protein
LQTISTPEPQPRRVVFFAKTLTALPACLLSPSKQKTTDAADDAEDKKNVIDYATQRKNRKTKKLPPLWNQHKIVVAVGGFDRVCRSALDFQCNSLDSGRDISRLQDFEAYYAIIGFAFIRRIYGNLYFDGNYNDFIVNDLIS